MLSTSIAELRLQNFTDNVYQQRKQFTLGNVGEAVHKLHTLEKKVRKGKLRAKYLPKLLNAQVTGQQLVGSFIINKILKPRSCTLTVLDFAENWGNYQPKTEDLCLGVTGKVVAASIYTYCTDLGSNYCGDSRIPINITQHALVRGIQRLEHLETGECIRTVCNAVHKAYTNNQTLFQGADELTLNQDGLVLVVQPTPDSNAAPWSLVTVYLEES